MPVQPHLWWSMNLGVRVENDQARRCFMHLDSIVLSTEA